MKRNQETKSDLSRRDFIKTTAVGVGAAAFTGLSLEEAKAVPPPTNWDFEADVVVVGYGFGGATAAIAAHDAGANVLVLEKSPTPQGGNSGCSSGSIHTCAKVDDIEDFIKKIRFGGFGTVTDEELIRKYAFDTQDTLPWLENLGMPVIWSRTSASNSRPAGSNARIKMPDGSAGAGKDIFAFLHGVVTAKGIAVKCGTPAKRLIQDPETKEIVGVVAESEGWDRFIKANKGVVLACGGYENNPQLQGWFNYPGLRLHPWGTPYNTGDGIKMCYSVGADLWHLHGLEWATVGFRKATESVGCSVGTNATTNIVPYNYIFVNKYGQRFVDDSRAMGHDIAHKPVTDFDDVKTEYPNFPFFLVCDDTLIKAGPLSPRQARTNTWTSYNSVHSMYIWSNDNSVEIEKGWVVKADTITELAAKIKGVDPSGNTVGVDPAGLAETINKYNSYVAAGKDPDFDRPANRLVPIVKPPFYAVELSLTSINTQGGPVRNKNCQTVDVNGKPIPGLYSVGEFGSINGYVYVAGNILEALTTGRVAGLHAAGR